MFLVTVNIDCVTFYHTPFNGEGVGEVTKLVTYSINFGIAYLSYGEYRYMILCIMAYMARIINTHGFPCNIILCIGGFQNPPTFGD